uniref:Deleted in lymphocytic leukemia 7 n=1 Tax=Nothoprocta perdicaria TaxID=30464 RepID=A0A8C7EBJ6_NOTPE
MVGPAALLASVSHQLRGLRTLRLLQESHRSPHCHTAPFLTSGGSWHGLGEACGSPGMEREAPGVQAASMGRALGQAVTSRTLREVAAWSRLARVTTVATCLVETEKTLLLQLLMEHPFPVHLEDSIEFRNICSHMALQKEGQQFDRDLYEAHQCLKTIIEKLICSLAAFPSESYVLVRAVLRQILQNLLTI